MKYQKALGFYSEQSMESVHFEFNKVWSKYQLKREHPNYPKKLLDAVNEFNSLHI